MDPLECRIINIIRQDVDTHVTPTLRRAALPAPYVGCIQYHPAQRVYDASLVCHLGGNYRTVEHYLLDEDLRITYPRPSNEIGKVIAARLP